MFRITEEILTRSDASGWTSDALEIHYPETIAISDSDTVEAKWAPRGPGHFGLIQVVDPSPTSKQGQVIRKELSLSGSAFLIKPQEILASTVSRDDRIASWAWSISPLKEGNQKLLLDLRDLTIRYSGGDHDATIQMNKEKPQSIEAPGLDHLALPITVLTNERLTLRSYILIKYGLAAFGAIMLYPAISTLLTKIIEKANIRKKRKRRKNA